MSNLAKRVWTAVVLIPLVVVLTAYGRPYGFECLIIVIAMLSFSEFIRMMSRRETGPSTLGGIVIASLGLLYVGLLVPLVKLHARSDGVAWIFLTATLVFLGDTGAYFVGRAFGRRKLAPHISPHKTVEGALGGLCASVAAVVLAKTTYLPSLHWIDCLLLGVPAALLAQLGDLAESMLKRAAKVKDSGSILPGHGGMLDRIDGLLFSGPYIYFYAEWVMGS